MNWTTASARPRTSSRRGAKKHAVNGFAYADLVPHYEAIEKRLAIAKVSDDSMNANNRTLFDGCKTIGWSVDTLRRNVHACMQTGFCDLGCPVNAKRSMLVTMIPDAIDAGAKLVFRARADRFEVEADAIERLARHAARRGGPQAHGQQVHGQGEALRRERRRHQLAGAAPAIGHRRQRARRPAHVLPPRDRKLGDLRRGSSLDAARLRARRAITSRIAATRWASSSRPCPGTRRSWPRRSPGFGREHEAAFVQSAARGAPHRHHHRRLPRRRAGRPRDAARQRRADRRLPDRAEALECVSLRPEAARRDAVRRAARRQCGRSTRCPS